MAKPRVRMTDADARSIFALRGVHEATAAAAEAVAENARAQGRRVGDVDGGKHEIDLPISVRMFTTDRPHAVVAAAHPAGLADQAKNGTLTKAAGQAGLDVRAK